MSKFSRWFPSACLVALWASGAAGQTAPPPLPPPQAQVGIPSRPLLLEPAVQKEIGLSQKQRNNLEMIENQAQEARQSSMEEPGEEGFDFTTMMGGVEETARQQRSAINKVLTASQRTRLTQLVWQRQGWLALARPEVATRIKLGAPQVQKIQGIIDAMRQQQSQALFDLPDTTPKSTKAARPKANFNPAAPLQGADDEIPGGGPMAFTTEGMQAQAARTTLQATKSQAAAAVEVAKILTDEQKEAFTRLLGPPFNFKLLDEPGTAQDAQPAAPKRPAAGNRKSTRPR